MTPYTPAEKREALQLAINLVVAEKATVGKTDFDKIWFSPAALKYMKKYYQKNKRILQSMLDEVKDE